MVEEFEVIHLFYLASVASWVASVSAWHTLHFLHDATLLASHNNIVSSHEIALTCPEHGDLLPCCLQVCLEHLDAVVAVEALASPLRVVGVARLLADVASDLEQLALLHAMVLHVFADDAEAAALDALLELEVAVGLVGQRLLVLADEATTWEWTLEHEGKEVLLYVSVQISQFYRIVSLTFLGTGLIVLSPRHNAFSTEKRLTRAALRRLPNTASADAADEEVGPLPLPGVLLDQRRHVDVRIDLSAVRLRLVGETVWVRHVQLEHLLLNVLDGLGLA